jgi:hypothetical protein
MKMHLLTRVVFAQTAKINLDAQVLNLLQFNAGVDLSIDEVRLLIQDVNAKVLLEARLENVVRMINATLNSIDLNPIIATLGEDLGNIVNTTVGGLTGATGSDTLSRRSFELENYRANTHTNRILAQDGDLVDHFLDNDGNPQGQKVVGNYRSTMAYTGYERKTKLNGVDVLQREYIYHAAHGLSAWCAVYTGADGGVVATQVLAESAAEGSSTISED